MDLPTVPGENETQVPAPQQGQDKSKEDNRSSGIEKRIDELVAQRYEADRTVQSLLQENQALQRQMAEMFAAQYAPKNTAPEVPEELDPKIAKYFDSALEAKLKPVASRYEAIIAEQNAALARLEADRVREKLPEAVRGELEQTLADWKRRGIPGTLDDARLYLLGQAVDSGKYQAPARGASAAAALAAYNQGQGAPLPHGAAPNVAPRSAPAEEPEFDLSDPTQLAQADAYYRKKLGR